MNWHKRLTQAREAKDGMMKSELARLVPVKPSSVTDWENGQTKMIDGFNLVRVCEILGVTPQWIMTGKGPVNASGAPSAAPQWIDADAYKLLDLYFAADDRGRIDIMETASEARKRSDGRNSIASNEA